MKYLTIVYKIPDDYDTIDLIEHEFVESCSWCDAIDELHKCRSKVWSMEEE
jgi:hypothetical protein